MKIFAFMKEKEKLKEKETLIEICKQAIDSFDWELFDWTNNNYFTGRDKTMIWLSRFDIRLGFLCTAKGYNRYHNLLVLHCLYNPLPFKEQVEEWVEFSNNNNNNNNLKIVCEHFYRLEGLYENKKGEIKFKDLGIYFKMIKWRKSNGEEFWSKPIIIQR